MIELLEKLLNITIENKMIYWTAMHHTTFVNEKLHMDIESNERLEYLGDAVLELLVSEFLFKTYPDYPEGKLTTMRAQLVQENSLAYLARQLKLNTTIHLGNGEWITGGNERDSILADAYEAVLGAIYLDKGLEMARTFVDKTLWSQHIEMIHSISQDYKTELQEKVQKRGAVPISYRVVDQTGPAHDKRFIVEVVIDDIAVGTGEGRSKKQAEMQAAKNALGHINSKGHIHSEYLAQRN